MSAAPAATVIASFVASVRDGELPDRVRHEALRCFVNFAGCAIGGASHDAARMAYDALSPLAGGGIAEVLSFDQRADPATAALINGTAGSAHSYDCTHADAVIHLGAPVAAAALALAQVHGVAGREMLTALALGAEVAARLSQAVSAPPAEFDLSWYQTGIAGGVGAAVAAGRVLGLPESGIAAAIGIAVSQASGSRVMQGSMAMLMLAGHAAATGVRAALLARAGFEVPVGSLDGPFGFLDVFAHRANPAVLVADLGTRHHLLRNTYKAYPCGVVLHPVVDAALVLAGSAKLAQVREILVRVSPTAIALTDRPEPQNRTQAQVSLQHWAAVALAEGKAGLAQGEMASVIRPDIAALRRKVRIVPAPEFARSEAEVTLIFSDDQTSSHHATGLRGGLDQPLSDSELSRKFLDQAVPILGKTRAERALAKAWAAGHSMPGDLVLASG